MTRLYSSWLVHIPPPNRHWQAKMEQKGLRDISLFYVDNTRLILNIKCWQYWFDIKYLGGTWLIHIKKKEICHVIKRVLSTSSWWNHSCVRFSTSSTIQWQAKKEIEGGTWLRLPHMLTYSLIFGMTHSCVRLFSFLRETRGGGLGSRPKKMYGERLGDGVEYHSMKPTPRR